MTVSLSLITNELISLSLKFLPLGIPTPIQEFSLPGISVYLQRGSHHPVISLPNKMH